jgi:capsule polysaccharide export protein KpsE/RkpR
LKRLILLYNGKLVLLFQTYNIILYVYIHFYFVDIFPTELVLFVKRVPKGYDPLYSSSPLASLEGFSRSHGDGLYVMQLVVVATNQNALYKKHKFCRKNVNKIKMYFDRKGRV